VTLTGGNLPSEIIVDLLDERGDELSRVLTTAQPGQVHVTIPDSIVPGELLLRLGTRSNGQETFSQSLPIIVTAVGPAPTIETNMMMPVAPGQWTVLVLDANSERIDADRVDVEFRQGNQVAVSSHDQTRPGRIQVPAALPPGVATIRARLWRKRSASPWSDASEFELLPVPAPAVIRAVALMRDDEPVAMWTTDSASGPLAVREGDLLMVAGDFPFASPRVVVSAKESPREVVELLLREDRGQTLVAVLPALNAGEWILDVDGTPPSSRDPQAAVVLRVEQ
jgi:hypothetical protein